MGFLHRFASCKDRFVRNRVKFAGFFTGAGTVLLLGMLASVIITGRSFNIDEPTPVQVYTNF